MIKRFKVNKLNGIDSWNFDFELYPDVNVFTGKNGAGKTTVLKLLWYLVSGNIERVFPEITFDYALVEGDSFRIEIIVNNIDRPPLAVINWDCGGESHKAEKVKFGGPGENDIFYPIDIEIANASGSSVFFPTFRRIEGGFSISNKGRSRARKSNLLQDGMTELSETLSFRDHSFVSSIATDDIELLFTSQYAKISEETNLLQADLSHYIEVEIHGWEVTDSASVQENFDKARALLIGIRDKVRNLEAAREQLLKPFTVLTKLVGQLLKHKGIRIKDITTLGDVSAAIEAASLSAGEKQMLSFLCYNAFEKRSMIFIDEPEISLHVDWQRILLPKLMEQASDNQFIVSTHSPFIYSKYADREIVLDKDKGNADEIGRAGDILRAGNIVDTATDNE